MRGVLHDLCESGLLTVRRHRHAAQLSRYAGGCAGSLAAGALERRPRRTLVGAHLSRRPVHARRAATDPGRRGRARAGSGASAGSGSSRASNAPTGPYTARTLVLPLGSAVGWEAAVFDHFKAVVNTVTSRPADRPQQPRPRRSRGRQHVHARCLGPGTRTSSRRSRRCDCSAPSWVSYGTKSSATTPTTPTPERHTQVLIYVGQCSIERGEDEADES